MSCLEPDDLKNYKYRCQQVQLCCDDAEIQEALDKAQETVESYTGHKFCPEETCIFFDGNGKQTLFLTETTSLPLTNVDSVTILEWGKEDVIVDLDEIHQEQHTLLYRSGKCWPCGKRNIKVCGTFGLDLPSGVKSAILVLALEALQPGAAGIQHNSVVSSKWHDFSIQYRIDKTFDSIVKTTGFKELDQVLQNYINPRSQFMFGVVGDCPTKPCDNGCGGPC